MRKAVVFGGLLYSASCVSMADPKQLPGKYKLQSSHYSIDLLLKEQVYEYRTQSLDTKQEEHGTGTWKSTGAAVLFERCFLPPAIKRALGESPLKSCELQAANKLGKIMLVIHEDDEKLAFYKQ